MCAGVAAHQIGELARDSKAQAGAAVQACRAVVRLFEGIEQARQNFRPDADAGVLDFEAGGCRRLVFFNHSRPQSDAASIRELDCIAGKVEKGLPQTRGVAEQAAGEGPYIRDNTQALRFGIALQQ